MSKNEQNQSSSSTSNSQSAVTVTTNGVTYRIPSDVTLQNATKLSIVEDKPVMFDYWVPSLKKEALVGVRDTKEKLLVKSAEEYTSPISKFYRSLTEFIVITENSIYIVSSDIPTRKIS